MDQPFSVEAGSVGICKRGHVSDNGAAVVAPAGRLRGWEATEHCVGLVLDCLELLPTVELDAGVLEVGALLEGVRPAEGQEVVLAPALVPVLFRNRFHDLSLAVVRTLDVLQ